MTGVRLLLVRHGESAAGAEGRYAGHLDSPLSPRGRQQVVALRSRFRRYPVDRIVSSDLLRCRETVELLAPGREVALARELRELHFGCWEGRAAAECWHQDPVRYERWLRDPWRVAPPGGERLDELAARVRAFLDRLAASCSGQTVAVITHAGPIRVIAAPDPSRIWTVHVPPASLLVRRWRLREGVS